ncbi:MAG: OmpA family protein, partial [Bradyrhizobium sp.]
MHGFFKWSSKWWPGLVPLAALIAIAAWTDTAPLESDLAAGSAAAVRTILLDKTQISVSGRDVRFDAEAFSDAGRRRAVAAVEAVPGVRLVDDDTRLVPEAKPFVWSVERDVAKITLAGDAPLPATKGTLLGAARAAIKGVQVVDQMSLARGAPRSFDDAALLLIDQIG